MRLAPPVYRYRQLAWECRRRREGGSDYPREQGLDEDGVEPGEVIVLEEYMDGETQELRSLGTSDVHGV